MHPVRAIFNSMPSPRRVLAHLVEFDPQPDGTPGFWTVRLYRDDFDPKSAEDRLAIFNWVGDVISSIRVIEPNCWPEVWESYEGTPK